MARLYLGIDGGQSSTVALIANEDGRIIGRGRGGPCNHVGSQAGRAKFLNAVGDCVAQAYRAAGIDSQPVKFSAACLGFSGGGEDKLSYVHELIDSHKYKVTHDAEIALAGATAGKPGIIVIAGTGSIAFGRNGEGRMARAGGWGYIFGDEGGGFDIARRALRAALQDEEGWGPETALRDVLIKESNAASANELMHRFYADLRREEIATLAQTVHEAATRGDAVAQKILGDAAGQLASYVEGVYRNLFRTSETVPVAHIGGVFRSVFVREQFAQSVQERIGCPCGPPLLSPAAGALLEALRLDGNMSALSDVPESEK
jgi:N-acetylglucosamine kinase-like BadF-type ATPase